MFNCLGRASLLTLGRGHRVSSNFGSHLRSARCITSSKEYPQAPRVGIGVVILRRLKQQAEVLLIRRGTEPNKGMLCFPGGTLELGETMAQCAVRESWEETGLRLRNDPQGGEISSRSLAIPRPVDAVDAIHRDSQGRVQFHYTIVDLAAVPEDASVQPVAADDADQVVWTPVDDLHGLTDLVENCARIAHEAVLRFDIPEQTT